MLRTLIRRVPWIEPCVAGRLSALQIAFKDTVYHHSNWRSILLVLSQRRKKQLIIVISTKRSGTNLVCNILHQYPNAFSNYEIMNVGIHVFAAAVSNGSEVHDYLQHSASVTAKDIVVSKIFHEHLEDKGLSWATIANALKDCKIIHLVRHDLLAQYASLLTADASSEWTTSNSNSVSSRQTIAVNISEFKLYAAQRIQSDASAAKAFKNHPDYIQFSYEEFATDPINFVATKLAPRYGLTPYFKIERWTKKPKIELSMRIENWKEIESEVSDDIRYNPHAHSQRQF